MEGSKWEEDIYWAHFKHIHFSQFLLDDFHQQLVNFIFPFFLCFFLFIFLCTSVLKLYKASKDNLLGTNIVEVFVFWV